MWVAWLLACGGEPGVETPLPSRVQAIPRDPASVETAEAFCDTFTSAEGSRRFPPPPLAEGAWAAAPSWRWVNVWATWCGPCIAEMPTLVAWQAKLREQGVPVDLVFVSVDKDQPEVDRFYRKHPDLPPSLRISDAAELPGWLAALGIDAGTAIPIHLFVDREDRLRCVRTGALDVHHLSSVRGLLGR